MGAMNIRDSAVDSGLQGSRCKDGGYAMVIAVLASSLMVSVATALLLSLASGGSESVRQREIYVARATGVGALDYMMDQLRDDADLFKNYLDTSPPSGWSDPNWLETASTANAPAPDTPSDWYRLSDGSDGDLTVEGCTGRETCWTLRWSDNESEAADTEPVSAVVEAIVRFRCKQDYSCSLRYFQQRVVKETDWRRLDVTEVTGLGTLS